jgi:NAD(P)-dependent dehydrogenase (short-subunit alcohol dehydrogenase family)
MGAIAEDVRKVAIVTGASSGMGTALATRLIEKGWRVALFDINQEAGTEIASRLGANAAFFKADVSSYASQAAAFSAVFSKWGRIDALLANAGIVDRSSIFILRHRSASVDDIPPAPDLSTTDIDYKGVVYGVQLAIHFMRHNSSETPGGKKIIATASIAGVVPHPTYPEYNGAKAAVINFVRGVGPILKIKEGITFGAVCPGIVDTPIIPQALVTAVSKECLTPVETIVRAYEEFLDDDGEGRAGEVVECSADKIIPLKMPEMGNGKASKRAVTGWEPLFRQMHGEDSCLPDAIP